MVVEAPAGIVTFLFTDIEGSGRLWEEQPQSMAQALARHDALARDAVAAHRGRVVKTTGDGMYAVFLEAPQAIAAALVIQAALVDPATTAGVPIRVRCGLHAGHAEERDSDYFGSTLNRAARIMAAAHGGQVLLSQAVVDLVGDRVPAQASLRDLGAVRLRDLARPEHVYQLVHAQLRQNFPALRSLESTPNNLPQQLTSFVGRARELTETRRLLAGARLLTLTGPGGIGKTRLSLQVAGDVMDAYPDGVWFVELAAIVDSTLVPKVVAQVLDVQADADVTRALCAHLKSRRVLLVLDNCEHLVNACAKLTEVLLQGAPTISILASSREPLKVQGEQTYALPPLSLAATEHGGRAPVLSDAVQLFVERARLQQAHFALTDQLLPAVTQLCARLDGIPLALELAAARVGVLPVEKITERLNDRFHLLTGGSRTALPRQQTLRALIDWSYDLLDDAEKILFSRLSVFAGGWTLDAAEAIGAKNDIAPGNVLDLLTGLVQKSLVIPDESDDRYDMLETIREYGGDRLRESGEAGTIGRRHRDYFLALSEEAEPSLDGSRDQPRWLVRLELEHDNLRAALARSINDTERNDAALRLCGALYRFWAHRGHAAEGRELCIAALAREADGTPTAVHLKALHALGLLTWRLGDVSAARTSLEEALQISRALGDRPKEASILNNLGGIAIHQADVAAAQAYLEQAVAIHRDLGNGALEARCLNNLSALAISEGHFTASEAVLERSLMLSRMTGSRTEEANAASHLGFLALRRGDHAAAQALHEQALAIAREFGVREFELEEVRRLGEVAITRHELQAARALLRDALVGNRELGNRFGIAECLDSVAGLAVELTVYAHAASLAGAADALREAIETPRGYAEREYHDMVITKCREVLGEAATATAIAAGRALPSDQASDVALAWLEVNDA
jgi:predicted ATPase/class 3 adenylate cyclase